jgi:medium-chain acyl-[acyl-carrier-protein] hydrolase
MIHPDHKQHAWCSPPRTSGKTGRRLFCLPHAGGTAAAFTGWDATMPSSVEVCAVELPGRGRRVNEPLFTEMRPLVEALAAGLRPFLDRPFALFGHSMGARICFELAVHLEEAGLPRPSHLFISGATAPGFPRPESLANLPDAELLQRVQEMDGIHPSVMDHPELVAMILPVLRADLSVNGTATAVPRRFGGAITAFGGRDDGHVPLPGLHAWRSCTRSRFDVRVFPGGHFFLKQSRRELIKTVVERLDSGNRGPGECPALPSG